MIIEKPLAGALGAEIEGIDLTKPLSENDYKQIRKLLIEHEVIFLENKISAQLSKRLWLIHSDHYKAIPLIKPLKVFQKLLFWKVLLSSQLKLRPGIVI